MENRGVMGDASNIAENAPVGRAGNGCLASQRADEARKITDVAAAADRSVQLQDRGETIEDILLELKSSGVIPPAETLDVHGEGSDGDSKCDRKTESIASSGCAADVLEEDGLDSSGVDPEPRTSEIDDDDFIVADEASADEAAAQEDSTIKEENEEDRVPPLPAPENNVEEEKNEFSEGAVGDTLVAETAVVTHLDSGDRPAAGSSESGSVKEPKMQTAQEKIVDNASEVPGTPRRTGRQRNAPQRLVDSTETRSPERKHNTQQKPAAEEATSSLKVDQNSHSEAVPNGDDQTNKASSGRQHLTKTQRKLVVDDEAPALPKQATSRKRATKSASEETAAPSEAPGNVQPEIFSDDEVPLTQQTTKALSRGKALASRGKALAKAQSQLLLEDQPSAPPTRSTPRKRATKSVVEQTPLKASSNGAQPDMPSDSDVSLPVNKTRASPRVKKPSVSPKECAAKTIVEQALLPEATGTNAQVEILSDGDAPLAKRGKKLSPKVKTTTKAKKKRTMEEVPPPLMTEAVTISTLEGAVVPTTACDSSVQPDLLLEEDQSLTVRKTKASSKKQTVKANKQLALEEKPQAPSGRAALRKRPSKVDADVEAPSVPSLPRMETKTKGKRQKTATDEDVDVSAVSASETESSEKQKRSGPVKTKLTAAKSVTASNKTGQTGELPGEEAMELPDVLQEEQDTLKVDGSPLQQEPPPEPLFSSSLPRCIPGGPQKQDKPPFWRAEEFLSSDRLLKETVCLGLRRREETEGTAFLTIEVPSAGPRRCWGPKSFRRRPTVVFGGCDPYKMYVNVHGTRVLLKQWSRAANITPTVRLTDMFAAFSSE